MAASVNDRVDDPSLAGVEHYIGLEHLDSDSLKIRRWGSPEDVSATKLLFQPGDIIFGRRRAYQRKLGVAGFRGIASAHSLVLRAKPDVVLPEYLPFFMQSDLFMELAQQISVGSLSPTINWKTLARQEFALPPLTEQQQILRTLQAVEEAADACRDGLSGARVLGSSVSVEKQRGRGLGDMKSHPAVGDFAACWKLVPIRHLIHSSQYGLSTAPESSGTYPILRMMNIEDGWVVENDLKYVELHSTEYERYRLSIGDVLFNRTNSIDLVGRTGVYGLDGAHVFASYLVRLRVKTDVLLPEYLSAFLNGPVGRRQVLSFATKGVSQANVNARNLGRVLCPLPPIEYQTRVVALLSELQSVGVVVVRWPSESGRLTPDMGFGMAAACEEVSGHSGPKQESCVHG